ncbi:hypothetical protein A2960_06230 [Candidatus Gottesmanbacteria bacterium RIFCSPLOWO2_01_FULL_39_12b]|uniref:Ureidoglycolate hydrolase n=1 Tax=Candidatus Gottesmanbacteria bacterium RIFCSPLOWO2_01_FULL_39_12b TaxID=1798388 RepID=A0A1F6AP28_9BACT|nr:MAG: hypothetical protein A2960_06230 [Candidatus Gottesmanbacteria bacterium RIFCSPLOWO2_01_FULL_39_12b]
MKNIMKAIEKTVEVTPVGEQHPALLIHVRPLTPDGFSSFGSINQNPNAAIIDGKLITRPDTKANRSGPGWQCWSPIAESILVTGGIVGLVETESVSGYITIPGMERERSPEIQQPLDGEIVLVVAPGKNPNNSEELPDASLAETFLIPQNTQVTLNPGIWHYASLAVNKPFGEKTTYVFHVDPRGEATESPRPGWIPFSKEQSLELFIKKLPEGTEGWITQERPGHLGRRRDEKFSEWNGRYDSGNWRLVNVDQNDRLWTIEEIVFNVYAESYAAYFQDHPKEADWIVNNFSHAYELDEYPVPVERATDLYRTYNQPGIPNQFHAVALNYALMYLLNKPFKGNKPLRVYPADEGKPPPEGEKWHPGRIPCLPKYLELINNLPDVSRWYSDTTTIEHFYQATKALQVKK